MIPFSGKINDFCDPTSLKLSFARVNKNNITNFIFTQMYRHRKCNRNYLYLGVLDID